MPNHAGANAAWHFIYFGYSKTENRAYGFVKTRTGATVLNWANTKHYWAERFFFTLKDQWSAIWPGQTSLVNVNLGRGAFRAHDSDYNVERDLFAFGLGSERYMPTVAARTVDSGEEVINQGVNQEY